jgi:hypothetical protein
VRSQGSQSSRRAEKSAYWLSVWAEAVPHFFWPHPQTKKTTFSGNSQQATQLFELSGGLHRVEMTHQGDANFSVDLLDENGESVVPMGLVNEIGPFEGSRAMQVPDDGIYLFSTQANSPWTIMVE